MTFGAALFASLALALPQEAPASPEALQIRAKTILLADGRALNDAVLVVRDGKIEQVGTDVALDPSLATFDHDGTLTAGLVACRSFAGAAGETDDSTRSILPSARLVHAVDREHPDFGRALAEGITSVVITTGGTNVVGGHTVAFKTTGELLQADAHLALSFAGKALGRAQQRFFSFFSTPGAAADGGLETTGGGGRGTR